MNAGKLDQRVILERHEFVSQDELGQVIYDWVPVATLWAAVEPLNGREYIAASTTVAEVEARIRIRYRADLSVTDRLNHEGTLHEIRTIINPRSGDRELVLMCKAWAG